MSQRGNRGWVAHAVLGCALALAAVVFPAAASAAGAATHTYVIGSGGAPFLLAPPVSPSVALVSGGHELTIKTVQLAAIDSTSDAYWNFSITQPDPRGIEALDDGTLMIADAANHLAMWVGGDGQLLWFYDRSKDASVAAPVCASKVSNNSFLIVDRDAHRVFIAGLNNAIQWQYGKTGVAGSGADELDSPTSAEVLASGDIAICDAGNHRVIVVDRSSRQITWQYGTTGVSGSGADQLVRPTSVQRLTAGPDAGNTLICDQGEGRVIEVRSSDYAAGFSESSVVWEYPQGGGSGEPGCALGLSGSDGIVWVSDASDGHVRAIATGAMAGAPTAHEVVADLATGAPAFSGSLTAPASLSLAADGSVLVADPGAGRVVLLGTSDKPAYPPSKPLDCGWSGRKRFKSITVSYADIPTTVLQLRYQVDGKGSRPLLNPSLSGITSGTGATTTVTYPLPPKTAGTRLTYEVDMSQGSKALVPRVISISIAYQRIASSSGSGGGGEGGNNKGAGDGSYSYPGSSGGSGQGTGGGTGGGTGSGSGSGSGTGYGSGSSGSTTGAADVGTPMAGSPTGQELPDVVDPADGTAPGSDAQVSGYLMKASGYAGGGEGGGASPKQATTAGGWMLLPAGVGLLCLALFAVAAANENRRIRVYADYAPERPRGLPGEYTPTARPLPPPPIVRSPRRP